MTDKLATIPEGAIQLGELMHHAIDKGVSVETMDKLVSLHERIADRLASQEFARDFAAFQSECPQIQKTAIAKILTKNGGTYSYQYSPIDEIARTVNPILTRHGLSYSWDTDSDEARVRTVCTLRHANGHKVSSSYSAPIDREAKMNPTQQGGAALMYAKRQSLIAVLGLTSCDQDTDANVHRNGGGRGGGEVITAKQAADLEALIDEVRADRSKFLAYLGVDEVEMIPLGRYVEAVEALEDKRKRSK